MVERSRLYPLSKHNSNVYDLAYSYLMREPGLRLTKERVMHITSTFSLSDDAESDLSSSRLKIVIPVGGTTKWMTVPFESEVPKIV